jgi:hypothetical protein
MSIMRILFAVMAFILFCEMICGKTEDVRINCTFGYITTIVGIVVLYVIG